MNDIPAVSSTEDNVEEDEPTIVYTLNSTGCYHKLVNNVVQPGLYRKWNNTYARIDNDIPSEGLQFARFTGSFKYSYNGELYSLDAKGWQKARLNQLCPTKNEMFLFYSALKLQARQYGILLKPIMQLTEGESICPINDKSCDTATATYKEMTGILYQKLSHLAVIINTHNRSLRFMLMTKTVLRF